VTTKPEEEFDIDAATDDGPGYKQALEHKAKRREARAKWFKPARITFPPLDAPGSSGIRSVADARDYYADTLRYVEMSPKDFRAQYEVEWPAETANEQAYSVEMLEKVQRAMERALMGLEPETKTQPLSPHFARRIDIGDD
jgi:hypothetical protein